MGIIINTFTTIVNASNNNLNGAKKGFNRIIKSIKYHAPYKVTNNINAPPIKRTATVAITNSLITGKSHS